MKIKVKDYNKLQLARYKRKYRKSHKATHYWIFLVGMVTVIAAYWGGWL